MSAILDAVTPEMIAQCETLIRPHIRRTPVIEVDGAEFDLPAHRLTLKLELTQQQGRSRHAARSPTCSAVRCRRPASLRRPAAITARRWLMPR